jgi:4-amino-4-deoxy-L-arabinose transferase-like glycosyltransferase
MRFVDFLRSAVLLSAGAATALAAVTVLSSGASQSGDVLVLVIAGWWLVAALIGGWIGRQAQTNSPIARLLASAKSTASLPEQRPGSLLVNRLWPLLLSTLVALGLGLIAPQVPGIATGFAIIGALAWRRQEAAVSAIEERDGVAFYVEPTPPLKPIRLVRAPGFRRDAVSVNGTLR